MNNYPIYIIKSRYHGLESELIFISLEQLTMFYVETVLRDIDIKFGTLIYEYNDFDNCTRLEWDRETNKFYQSKQIKEYLE